MSGFWVLALVYAGALVISLVVWAWANADTGATDTRCDAAPWHGDYVIYPEKGSLYAALGRPATPVEHETWWTRVTARQIVHRPARPSLVARVLRVVLTAGTGVAR